MFVSGDRWRLEVRLEVRLDAAERVVRGDGNG